MRTYDLTDDQGRVYAFEIDNLWLDRASLAAMVRQIPGARLQRLEISWWGPDRFCEFELNGTTFEVSEPFGDNSRYWVGPKPPRVTEQVELVRSAFAAYQPRWSLLARVAVALVLVGMLGTPIARFGGITGRSLSTYTAVALVLGLGLGAVAAVLRRRRLRTTMSEE